MFFSWMFDSDLVTGRYRRGGRQLSGVEGKNGAGVALCTMELSGDPFVICLKAILVQVQFYEFKPKMGTRRNVVIFLITSLTFFSPFDFSPR